MSNSDPKDTVVVIIPRSDPTEMPNRNSYALWGRPLIGWPVDAARRSRYVTQTFVSTRDDALSEVVKEANGEIIPRPPELDNDRTSRVAILRHAVTWLYKDHNLSIDTIIALRSTIPEVSSSDIDTAIEFLQTRKLKEALSVGNNLEQNDDIRVIRGSTLFNTTLSSRIGVFKTHYIDVRSVEDIAKIQNKYETRERFDAMRN